MSFFINVNKTVKLDCYNDNKNIVELFPITRARDHIPQWWKDLPIPPKPKDTRDPEELTRSYGLKGCPGFIEYYKLGFVMPMWTDMILHAAKEENDFETYAQPSDETTQVKPHPPNEWSGLYDPKEYMHFKIESNWMFECSHSIDWLYGPCQWNTDKLPERVRILMGHMNYKLFSSTNVQMFLKRGKTPVVLESGMPLMHIIPLTEKKVEVECHYDPAKKLELMDKHSKFSFSRRFYKKKKLDK